MDINKTSASLAYFWKYLTDLVSKSSIAQDYKETVPKTTWAESSITKIDHFMLEVRVLFVVFLLFFQVINFLFLSEQLPILFNDKFSFFLKLMVTFMVDLYSEFREGSFFWLSIFRIYQFERN